MARTKKAIAKRKEIVQNVIANLKSICLTDVKVKNICQMANISVGSFYHHFEDLNDFLNEILLVLDDFLLDEVLPVLDSEHELENMRRFIYGYYRYVAATGHLVGQTISALHITLPATEASIAQERKRPLYEIPRQILKRGRSKGQIITEIADEDLLEMLVLSLRGISYDWSRRSQYTDIEKEYRIFAEMMVATLTK